MLLIKDKTFLSIYIPNYLEFSVLFILAILDTVFIALVEPRFVTVLGITHSLLIIVFVTSQTIANITAAHLTNIDLSEEQKHYWVNKTLLLTFLTGIAYVSFILLLVPYLLTVVNLENNYQHLNYVFIVIILLGAIFVALRRGINAIFNIYRMASINLYSSLIIVVFNVIFNVACYLLFFNKNNEWYLLGIGLSTFISQVIVPIGLIAIMVNNKTTSFKQWRDLLKDKKNDWIIIKTGFISSLEAGSYTVMTYVFIAVLSHISQAAFVTRTMLIPWFQMVGALSAAWVGYANRELAFCWNAKQLDKFELTVASLINWGKVFSSIGLLIMLAIFTLIQSIAFKELYSDAQALHILIIVFLCLALIEFFRVRNVIALTALRLLKYVGRSTMVSIMCHIVWLMSFFIIYQTQNSLNTLLAVGLMFGLMVVDEYFRGVYNYSLLRKFINNNDIV
ncbi:hypothetical protein [Thiofilum flexile]|uniref:hypothetical protein n=1 Tax=Thiofilum flexile TaxID=125627 RepID=UPI00037A5DF9|nr:hypothetical protein [Thiofilum flexile]